jgi:amino acid adenylation domain-containing protein
LADTVARCPDRPAVIELDHVVTLAQLYERSLSIAAALRQWGLEPSDRVGLVMDKSADAIALMYGTLIAHGIYVPIQPGWPRRRIDAVLVDCGARFAAFDSEDDGHEPPTLIDRRSGEALTWPVGRSIPLTTGAFGGRSPDDPAFLLFTSGSTGAPKGVTVSHRAVGAFVDWSAQQFELQPDDRIACPSPLSFDLSTLDVFNIARSGSSCVIVPRAAMWVPRFLHQLARDQQATVWYSVPSVLMHLLDDAGLERNPVSSLRVILSAGEVMPPRGAARLRKSHPRADLYNLYGPTETNVVTWYRLPDEFDTTRPIPIGYPCPYAHLRLASPIEEAPGQESGELLVAGASVMSGYWNQPDETAKAFVYLDDDQNRALYYRTGDHAAVGTGGEWMFIGRTDRQIKHRGFRVELDEIEAALLRYPALTEAAVIASEQGSERLSAFVCARGPHVPSVLELRAHCAAILPSYMIPDCFVVLQSMPRGSRGKVDYEALTRWSRSST